MIIEGRAVVIAKDDVDTDVLYPGQYLNVLDVTEMTKYLFEGLDPSLRDELTGDTILFAGENFGSGSSRENVPVAMRAAGIRCVVAKSFARIFHRNCINLGLPAMASPEAAAAVTRLVRSNHDRVGHDRDRRAGVHGPPAAGVRDRASGRRRRPRAVDRRAARDARGLGIPCREAGSRARRPC